MLPFCRWRNWGFKCLSSYSKAILGGNGWASIRIRKLTPNSPSDLVFIGCHYVVSCFSMYTFNSWNTWCDVNITFLTLEVRKLIFLETEETGKISKLVFLLRFPCLFFTSPELKVTCLYKGQQALAEIQVLRLSECNTQMKWKFSTTCKRKTRPKPSK